MDNEGMAEFEGAGRAVRLAVIEMEGAWRLFLNGEAIGRFQQRRDAVGCALDVAGMTRSEGAEVEVLAHDRFGELRTLGERSRAPEAAGQRAAA